MPFIQNKSFSKFCAFYKDILHFLNPNTAPKNKILNNWTNGRFLLGTPGYGLCHLLIHSYLYSFIRSVMYSFIQSVMYSFIHYFPPSKRLTLSFSGAGRGGGGVILSLGLFEGGGGVILSLGLFEARSRTQYHKYSGLVIKNTGITKSWYTDIDWDGHEISHFGGLPRELYFPAVHSTEGKYCPEGKYNYLGTTDTWYFNRPGQYVILDGQNEWFQQNILCAMTTTNFGNKTRSLRTKQTESKLDRFARVLLWHSIVDHCVLCLRGAFLSGSVS